MFLKYLKVADGFQRSPNNRKSWIGSVFLFFFYGHTLLAQISGLVLDENKQPLPYASVYIDQTSRGTTTNAKGEFILKDTPDSTYHLVIKYLGYKTLKIKIGNTISNPLTFPMEVETIELQTLVVRSGGEDPAYAMIRKAMEKRSYYLNQLDSYKVHSYVKGKMTLDSIPPFLEKSLDSTMVKTLDDLKILYLSETISDLYYIHPNIEKEIIHSSQVSGDPRGFSFNQAAGLRINPYKKGIELQNTIVSPIAPNAFHYYHYQWVGAYFEGEHLINKIKLIPKNNHLPAFSGHLYLMEDTWNVYACEFSLDGKRFGNELIKQIDYKLDYIEIGPGMWVLYNQNLSFTAGLMGLQFSGFFSAVFTNYSMGELPPEKVFKKNESVKMLPEANQKDFDYWESIRPLPLEKEERKDYKTKDSLRVLRESPEYKDSLQRISNRYTLMSPSLGYTYNNWRKNYELGHSPLLDASRYNPIQGIAIATKLFYAKTIDQRKVTLYNELNFGLDNNKLLPVGGVRFTQKGKEKYNFQFEGGTRYLNFNPEFSAQDTESSFYNTFFSRNFERLFRKDFMQLLFSSAHNPQFRYSLLLEAGHRSVLANNLERSYLKTKNSFTENQVPIPRGSTASFEAHNYVKGNLRLSYLPFMKYKTMPDRYLSLGTKWPKFTLEYAIWKTTLQENLQQKVALEIQKNYINIQSAGYSHVYFKTGLFIQAQQLQLPDVQFLNGNEAHFKFNTQRLDFFRALPNYTFSEKYFSVLHWEHHFMGWIINRLPLIRKTGFRTTMALRAASTENMRHYLEPSLGMENIGWKYIRPLKIEYIPFTLKKGEIRPSMWVIGLNFSVR
jgi:hypothetical protein